MPRVLIAIDGSDLSRRAAERAVSLLTPGSDLTLVTVVRPAVTAMAFTGGAEMAAPAISSPESYEEEVRDLVKDAEADLRAVAHHLARAGASIRVTTGEPGAELCRLVVDGNYDLLVVGSHGSGFLKRVVLGSVSHHVLHHASCPVLAVRHPDAMPDDPANEPNPIASS